ncbi:MAG: hypothetical protein QM775_24380 [Pirellulales bacterium]
MNAPRAAIRLASDFLSLTEGGCLVLNRLEWFVEFLQWDALDGLLRACWRVIDDGRTSEQRTTLLQAEIHEARQTAPAAHWWELPASAARTALYTAPVAATAEVRADLGLLRIAAVEWAGSSLLAEVLVRAPSPRLDLLMGRWLWSLFDGDPANLSPDDRDHRDRTVAEEMSHVWQLQESREKSDVVTMPLSAVAIVTGLATTRALFAADRLAAFADLADTCLSRSRSSPDTFLLELQEISPGFATSWSAYELNHLAFRQEWAAVGMLLGDYLDADLRGAISVQCVAARIVELAGRNHRVAWGTVAVVYATRLQLYRRKILEYHFQCAYSGKRYSVSKKWIRKRFRSSTPCKPRRSPPSEPWRSA